MKCALVVIWMAIQFWYILAIINKWRLRQLDIILAYPQESMQFDMYMELPHVITKWSGWAKDEVLKLHCYVHGEKQADCVWNKYVISKRLEIGFKKSNVDQCVFFHEGIIFILYINDGIFFTRHNNLIDCKIKVLIAAGFYIENQGYPSGYIEMKKNLMKSQFLFLSLHWIIPSSRILVLDHTPQLNLFILLLEGSCSTSQNLQTLMVIFTVDQLLTHQMFL